MASQDSNSTDLLLNSKIKKNRSGDDLTIYSDDHSEMESIGSIELGRSKSRGYKGLSPSKMDNMGLNTNVSPSKRLQNDYMDHIYKMRTGTNNPSPRKRLSYDLSEFGEYSDDDHSLELESLNLSRNTIDREIDRLLEASAIKPLGGNISLDPDKSELIIKETHKLVNSLPDSLAMNKEGEKYQRLLSNSINKLIKQYERAKRDVKSKNNEIKLLNQKIRSLESRMQLMQRENGTLKRECSQLNKRSTAQSNLKENDLLRSKLVKYRNLYLQNQKELDELKNASNVSEQNLAEREINFLEPAKNSDFNRLANLLQEIVIKGFTQPQSENSKEDFNTNKKIPKETPKDQEMVPEDPLYVDENAKQPSQENEFLPHNLKLLKIFQEMLHAPSKEARKDNSTQPEEPQPIVNNNAKVQSQADGPLDTSKNFDPEDDVFHKILNAIEERNDLYTKLIGALNLPPPHQDSIRPSSVPALSSSPPTASESNQDSFHNSTADLNSSKLRSNSLRHSDERDIVLQCYLCCPHSHLGEIKPPARTPCQQCSTVSSAENQSFCNDNKTISLMGEYKWTL